MPATPGSSASCKSCHSSAGDQTSGHGARQGGGLPSGPTPADSDWCSLTGTAWQTCWPPSSPPAPLGGDFPGVLLPTPLVGSRRLLVGSWWFAVRAPGDGSVLFWSRERTVLSPPSLASAPRASGLWCCLTVLQLLELRPREAGVL